MGSGFTQKLVDASLCTRDRCSIHKFNLRGLRTSMPSVHCIEGIRIRCLEKRRCLLRVSRGRAALSSACIHAALRASERTTPRFFWYFFLLIYHVRLSLLVSHGFDDISNLLCVCSQPTNCPHCATQALSKKYHTRQNRGIAPSKFRY